jgi:hypothetical protein
MGKRKKKSIGNKSNKSALRRNYMGCAINDDEKRIIDDYLHRYKITNKSRWFRTTVLSFIYKNLDKDYPTLFGENDMRR